MKNLLRLSISTLLILVLFTMNDCKKNVEEPKITLSNVSVTLLIGESSTLTYTITPSTINKDVEWTSDNQTVASVQNGEIKALTVGSANITVKVKNSTVSAICQVTVNFSKKPLLTSHIWKFNDLSSTNFFAQIYINSLKASYGKNATINFLIDGTYTGSVTGQTENGHWEFNIGETSIIIDKDTAYEIKADIVQLTSNVLELNAIYHDATLGDIPVTIILWSIR